MSKIKTKVLIIDDEQSVLTLMKSALDGIPDKILTATTGRIGIDLAVNNCDSLALILIDVKLPDMTGCEVIRILKYSNANKVPMIMMSGYFFDKKEKEKAYSNGAIDILKKPFNISILKQKTKSFVSMHRSIDSCKLMQYSKESVDPAIDTIHKLTDRLQIDFEKIVSHRKENYRTMKILDGVVHLHGLLNKTGNIAVSDLEGKAGTTMGEYTVFPKEEMAVGIVYEGKIVVEIKGKKTEVSRGGLIHIEPNVKHKGYFAEDSKMIVVTIPPSDGFPKGYADERY